MGLQAQTQQFSENAIRQVQLDCFRALARARFCSSRSEVHRLRCVDYQPESESEFGNQLWYFEAVGVDDFDRRYGVFGAIEYSTQFGLNELVEDGVFTSERERERFRNVYDREFRRPSWRQPAHRMLALGLICVSAIWLTYLLVRTLSV